MLHALMTAPISLLKSGFTALLTSPPALTVFEAPLSSEASEEADDPALSAEVPEEPYRSLDDPGVKPRLQRIFFPDRQPDDPGVKYA